MLPSSVIESPKYRIGQVDCQIAVHIRRVGSLSIYYAASPAISGRRVGVRDIIDAGSPLHLPMNLYLLGSTVCPCGLAATTVTGIVQIGWSDIAKLFSSVKCARRAVTRKMKRWCMYLDRSGPRRPREEPLHGFLHEETLLYVYVIFHCACCP